MVISKGNNSRSEQCIGITKIGLVRTFKYLGSVLSSRLKCIGVKIDASEKLNKLLRDRKKFVRRRVKRTELLCNIAPPI